jgi:heterodisulfide reductase subunit C
MSMYDDEFEQGLEWMREDHYARQMERCANCGSAEVSCTAGNEAFCGDCFRERAAEKAARRAARP